MMIDDIPFDALSATPPAAAAQPVGAPPQMYSLEAEIALLSGMLESRDSWGLIIDAGVQESDFYRHEHKLIYRCANRLHESGEPVNQITVFESLRAEGLDEQAGGLPYINNLQGYSSPAYLISYSKIVKERAVKRRLADAARSVLEAAHATDGKSIDQLVDFAEETMSRAAEDRLADSSSFVSLDRIYEQVLPGIFDRIESGDDALPGTTTGLEDLDEVTGGLQSGDLIILAARPSMGKTAMAINMALAAVKKDPSSVVAIFSLEMPASSIALRILSRELQIEYEILRRANRMNEDQVEKIVSAEAAQVQKHLKSIHARDAGGMSISAIRSEARRLKRQLPKGQKLSAVYVDYIQMMSGSDTDSSENRSTELGVVSRGLKLLAKELDCPVVALSQLNRSVESRTNKRPLMSDLRESGAIEQDADVIMMLYRDDYYNQDSKEPGVTEVIIGKQRNGPTGTVRVGFNARFGEFYNIEQRAH